MPCEIPDAYIEVCSRVGEYFFLVVISNSKQFFFIFFLSYLKKKKKKNKKKKDYLADFSFVFFTHKNNFII